LNSVAKSLPRRTAIGTYSLLVARPLGFSGAGAGVLLW